MKMTKSQAYQQVLHNNIEHNNQGNFLLVFVEGVMFEINSNIATDEIDYCCVYFPNSKDPMMEDYHVESIETESLVEFMDVYVQLYKKAQQERRKTNAEIVAIHNSFVGYEPSKMSEYSSFDSMPEHIKQAYRRDYIITD